MALEDGLQRIRNIVGGHIGEYSPVELTRRLRLSYLKGGLVDPGLPTARGIVQKAISNGDIEVREKGSPPKLKLPRCYPKKYQDDFTSTSQPHHSP